MTSKTTNSKTTDSNNNDSNNNDSNNNNSNNNNSKDKNLKIISSFDIFQNNSKELCLIDPMILLFIIIAICLFLYIIGFKLSKKDIK
jgi:hypothetical protein